MKLVGLISAVCVLVAVLGSNTAFGAETKTVNIVGTGDDAQYVEDGKTKQLNVFIKVGDSVKWVNPTGNKTHTVTSDIKDSAGRLFDETMNAGTDKTVTFDQARYDRAVKATGAAPGDRVFIGYFCAKHPKIMGGKIVLEPSTHKERKVEH